MTEEEYSWEQVTYPQQNNNAPLERWGHKLVQTNCHQLLLFGGFGGESSEGRYLDDLWEFNLQTYQWKQFPTTGDAPQSRSNYTIHYNERDHQIVLFGGGSSNKIRFNTVCILDLETRVWEKVKPDPTEDAPWERTYHTGEFHFPYLIVHGGEGVSNIDLDDCWAFNVTTRAWSKLEFDNSQQKPTQRRFHSSVLLDSQLYIIGGCKDNYDLLGDIYRVNLSQLFESNKTSGFVWEKVICKEKRLQRWGHTSNAYNGKIYIFAGRISSTTDTNDILIFDPASNSLENLNVRNKNTPKPRRRHATLMLGNCLITFGGYNGKYLNDFSFITLPKAKMPQQSINTVVANTSEEFALKLRTYQKKIAVNCMLKVRHRYGCTKLQTNNEIFLRNDFFRCLQLYSSSEEVSFELPSFCSLDMFRFIHLGIVENDAIFCRSHPLSYFFSLITTAEYFNCSHLIPVIEKHLMKQLAAENCMEMLSQSILLSLPYLKLSAAELYLKNGSTAIEAKGVCTEEGQTSDNFFSKPYDLDGEVNGQMHLNSIRQTLKTASSLFKFEIEQSSLRLKTPSILMRTAQHLKKIFTQTEQTKTNPPLSQKRKKEPHPAKTGCITKLFNFFAKLTHSGRQEE